jgi:hypothetical protein
MSDRIKTRVRLDTKLFHDLLHVIFEVFLKGFRTLSLGDYKVSLREVLNEGISWNKKFVDLKLKLVEIQHVEMSNDEAF